MSENITDLNMIQLKQALRQAALPADRQIASLRAFDVPFEVADDFGNWCTWALNSADVQLTDEQRSSLSSLNARLDEMSGEQRPDDLWTEEGLRCRPEWEEVRRDARKILDLFQWSEDTDVGT